MDFAIIEEKTVVSLPKEFFFRYFGWPTVARFADGRLVLAASGFRHAHMCPWGKSVVFESADEGATWGEPQIVNDSSVDDRDTGLLALPDGRLLLTWFSSDMRVYYPPRGERGGWADPFRAAVEAWSEENVARDIGSFVRIRDAAGVWGPRIPVTVTTPHGPTLLRDGSLLYLGKRFARRENGVYCASMKTLSAGGILAAASVDAGATWAELGAVPAVEGVTFHEPHAIELSDGTILGLLRGHPAPSESNAHPHFQIWKTLSRDAGRTWSTPEYLAEGSPPHLMRHSSGAIVCVYGYRVAPFGVRALVSADEGATWESFVLDAHEPGSDLGYPASVELSDGAILTAFYMQGDLKTVTWAIRPGRTA